MPADPMRPVRLADVPGVVWTMAWAFAGAQLPRQVRMVLAVVSVPMWTLALAFLPGLRHGADRRVVARLTRRTTWWAVREALQCVGLVLGIVALMGALALLAAASVPAVAVAVAVLVAAVLASATVVLATQLTRAAATRQHDRAPGSTTTDQHRHDQRHDRRHDRREDQRDWRRAGWQLDCVASRLPAGGLVLVHQHVRAAVPPGATVRVQAAGARHAEVYARYGLRPLPTRPLHLLAGGL